MQTDSRVDCRCDQAIRKGVSNVHPWSLAEVRLACVGANSVKNLLLDRWCCSISWSKCPVWFNGNWILEAGRSSTLKVKTNWLKPRSTPLRQQQANFFPLCFPSSSVPNFGSQQIRWRLQRQMLYESCYPRLLLLINCPKKLVDSTDYKY